MSGGLFQLVAQGAQDIYLTGDPQITFFKKIYRRHTNFSMESIEQTFIGTVDFGRRVSCTISRNGDLVHNMYLQITLPKIPKPSGSNLYDDGEPKIAYAWAKHIGHVLINSVEIEIGGQRIDKQYGNWMHIWNELSLSPNKKDGFDKMIGNINELTSFKINEDINSYICYVPLEFWFCKDPGLSIPLVALQYHEIKLVVEFNQIENCLLKATIPNDDSPSGFGTDQLVYNENISKVSSEEFDIDNLDVKLLVDYIFLDENERIKFSETSHEYLIEQLQFTSEKAFSGTKIYSKLNFNHPIKELVWIFNSNTNLSKNDYFNFTNRERLYTIQNLVDTSINLEPTINIEEINREKFINPVKDTKILMNGHNRFSIRSGDYFNWMQPYQHHTNIPSPGINIYSFSFEPEKHQPSGTCNMSRIDNVEILINLTIFNKIKLDGSGTITSDKDGGTWRVFALGYNVLRIVNGMGGVRYTN